MNNSRRCRINTHQGRKGIENKILISQFLCRKRRADARIAIIYSQSQRRAMVSQADAMGGGGGRN